MSRLSTPNTALEESRPFQGMSMVNENAAGVDIGAHEIMVCVRGSDHTQLVRSFGNYTADLYSIANWLGEHHICIVAMESSGTIRHAAKVAGIPVIVTKNGLSSEDDSRRVEYFQRALSCVADTLKEGIDVRGYFAWSLMDNYEWVSGFGPKFGIVAVDHATQKRTPKASAYWLGSLARTQRLPLL